MADPAAVFLRVFVSNETAVISTLRAMRQGDYFGSPMRFRLGKCIASLTCASVFIVCSCEKHRVGEDPEIQKEGLKVPTAETSVPPEGVSPTPSAKPTPAEFFPTKP